MARITGTPSDDNLRGTGGDDQLRGLAGDDQLFGLAGRDLLRGGEGSDLLQGGRNNDRIDGGAGSDTISFLDSTDQGVFCDLGSGEASAAFPEPGEPNSIGVDRFTGVEDIVGTQFRDLLNTDGAGSARNDLYGRGGDDLLQAGEGPDRLFGGAGRDDLRGLDGEQLLDGGSGKDIFRFGGGDYTVHSGGGDDRMVLSRGFTSTITVDDFAYGEDHFSTTGDDFRDAVDSNDNGRFDRGDDAVSVGQGDLTFDLSDFYGQEPRSYLVTLENYTSVATADLIEFL